jgi:aerobic carbon-monoxide dehydrogenase small subunit
MNDSSAFKSIRFQLNHESRTAKVEPHLLLCDFLRDYLGLKGTRKSGEVEMYGACTVLVDGRPVSSCATPAFEIDGKTVTTIEGLAQGDKLHPIQRAFWEEGGFECGYCTPGMILLAYALFTENPQPSDEEIKHWLSSNLCRCTGYVSIIAAISIQVDWIPLLRERRERHFSGERSLHTEQCTGPKSWIAYLNLRHDALNFAINRLNRLTTVCLIGSTEV